MKTMFYAMAFLFLPPAPVVANHGFNVQDGSCRYSLGLDMYGSPVNESGYALDQKTYAAYSSCTNESVSIGGIVQGSSSKLMSYAVEMDMPTAADFIVIENTTNIEGLLIQWRNEGRTGYAQVLEVGYGHSNYVGQNDMLAWS
jgi:hypothetical protein